MNFSFTIDIDCEDLNFETLRSNDWSRYRPIVLLVEVLPASTISELLNHPIVQYLDTQGYQIFAKCFNTCIFVEESNLEVLVRGEME